jgi:hypothetical protein
VLECAVAAIESVEALPAVGSGGERGSGEGCPFSGDDGATEKIAVDAALAGCQTGQREDKRRAGA